MTRASICFALAAALAACTSTAADPAGGSGSGSGSGSGVAPANLTVFVVDLVTNHTVDDAVAMEFDAFATLPDPDGEANNLEAYASLF